MFLHVVMNWFFIVMRAIDISIYTEANWHQLIFNAKSPLLFFWPFTYWMHVSVPIFQVIYNYFNLYVLRKSGRTAEEVFTIRLVHAPVLSCWKTAPRPRNWLIRPRKEVHDLNSDMYRETPHLFAFSKNNFNKPHISTGSEEALVLASLYTNIGITSIILLRSAEAE